MMRKLALGTVERARLGPREGGCGGRHGGGSGAAGPRAEPGQPGAGLWEVEAETTEECGTWI